MKNLNKFYKSKWIRIIPIMLIVLFSCDVAESPDSIFTPENFFQTESEVLSSLAGTYRDFAGIASMGVRYRILELSADQVLIHAKIQGWWDTPEARQLTTHTWTPEHPWITSSYQSFFNTVGQANALIASLNQSNVENVELPIAELRTLRAYAYFFLMDLFGNVPIFTQAKVDPNNLPEQNSRSEVFDFVVNELTEAAENLPSQTTVGSEFYGRLTKEAAYAILATVYLNAEVYTGTAQYDRAIEFTDRIINSGAFSLLPNYFDNFVADNAMNAEMIFPAVFTPNEPGGLGHPFVQKVLFGIGGGLFGLPFTPQNGFGTRPSVVELYEDQDVRKDMFITPGPLTDPRTGDTVMVERVVPDGNSQLFVPGESTEGPVPFEVIPATGIRFQPMNAGTKWIKWQIDPNTDGGDAGNDIAFFRFADILLIKAEALLRSGGSEAEALELVNRVRERSNASTLNSLTLDDILDERGRELAFEMTRRRDLIRFGEFTGSWEFKEPSEDFLKLYPIPREVLDANPKLEQNPGY